MKHYVIIVPGLSDPVKRNKLAVFYWPFLGLSPIIFNAHWSNNKENYELKINRLNKLIKKLSNTDSKISLIGMSAGGSLCINAYYENTDKIYRVINVCGRLKTDSYRYFHSFEFATKSSKAFKESVIKCENNLSKLTSKNKRNIMTIGNYFDEIVPHSTVPVKGAKNIKIPFLEHTLSISAAMTIFSNDILKFLR